MEILNVALTSKKVTNSVFYLVLSDLHLNYYGTKKLQEIFYTSYLHMIGVYYFSKDSIRVRNKSKGLLIRIFSSTYWPKQ